jgi:hypothetical protein
MADHHHKLSAPATGLKLNHSSTGWAVLITLKELKSSKYLFLVVGGYVLVPPKVSGHLIFTQN